MWIHFYSWGSLFVGSKNVPGFWRPYFFDSVIGIITINIKQMVVHVLTFMGQGFPTKATNFGPPRTTMNPQFMSGNFENWIWLFLKSFTHLPCIGSFLTWETGDLSRLGLEIPDSTFLTAATIIALSFNRCRTAITFLNSWNLLWDLRKYRALSKYEYTEIQNNLSNKRITF